MSLELALLTGMQRNRPLVSGMGPEDKLEGEPSDRLSSAEVEALIVNVFHAIGGSANPNRIGLGKEIADRLGGIASREYVLVVLERRGLRARKKVTK